MARMEEAEDAALADALEACDGYLEEHERAAKLLKQGFLKLAMARRHLPAHALGELSFHEFFDATAVVSAPADGDGAWRLERPKSAETANEPETSATLTHRKKAAGSASERGGAAMEAGQAEDAMLWFSSLPPNDLRQAQKLFADGLKALLDAAASARKVQAAVMD